MPQDGPSTQATPGGTAGFDWWAAPSSRVVVPVPRPEGPVESAAPVEDGPVPQPEPGAAPDPGPDESQPTESQPTEPGPAAGPRPDVAPVPAQSPKVVLANRFSTEPPPSPVDEAETDPARGQSPEAVAAVYRLVQAGEEFQQIRREYRRFVFPACAAFLGWYLLYIVAAVTLPELMDSRVAGPFNVAWLLGLLQFASTFLITWLYARHARDRRDRMALGLRWETQDRLR